MRKEEKLASDGSEDLKRHIALVIDRQRLTERIQKVPLSCARY